MNRAIVTDCVLVRVTLCDTNLTYAYPLSIFSPMKLPRSIRERFRAYGRAGGHARAESMSSEERSAVACRAAVRRWVRERFGTPDFKSLGLPGGEMVDAGLSALASGEETVESLLVSLAAPRLSREGVPVPRRTLPDAESRLYRLLQTADEDLAHARYLALERQMVSFADACAGARTINE